MHSQAKRVYCGLQQKVQLKMSMLRLVSLCVFLLAICLLLPAFAGQAFAKASDFNSQKVAGCMATAVGTDIAVSWTPLKQAQGYVIYEAATAQGPFQEVARTKVSTKILSAKTRGSSYHYRVQAWRLANGTEEFSKRSVAFGTTVQTGKSTTTLKSFLQTSVAPVGTTMYVWGGGWNIEDEAAGKDAKRIGLSPTWATFASKQKADYNYKKHEFKTTKGLDCSGYVGWTVYNVLNTKPNQKGYVTKASKQARWLSGQKMGTITKRKDVKNFRPGDIMSSSCNCCRHVYIVIGQCGDGSVVLVHASPAGVQINGTATARGKKESQAVKLARRYMKKYYPQWHKKYPRCDRPAVYLKHYEQMRWNIGDNKIMSDPHGYRNKDAAAILKDLYAE